MVGAQRGESSPPGIGRVVRQASLQRAIRHRIEPGLVQDPQRVEFAGRLDDPGQHQLPEHLVNTGGGMEPEILIRHRQRVPEVPHPRRGDRQRPARLGRGVQTEIELALPGRPRSVAGQRFSASPTRWRHAPNRGARSPASPCARSARSAPPPCPRPSSPCARRPPTTLGPRISAQTSPTTSASPQVNKPPDQLQPKRDPSRVCRCRSGRSRP